MSNKPEETKEREDLLTERMLETRTVLIYGEINQELAKKVCNQLIMLNQMSKEPIKIFLNSQGGHVEAGDTIHDMIGFIEAPVHMIGTGWVASAGITIYLGAEKENRYSLPNTRYMIHQPMGGAQGQATDVAIRAEWLLKTKKKMNQLMSEMTGQPLEKLEQDVERDNFMSAQEALAYGIVDEIYEPRKKKEQPKPEA